MAEALVLFPAVGEPVRASGEDAPFVIDDNSYHISKVNWGGGATRFDRKKTPHGEIVTPLGTEARTLNIFGEYHAKDHVINDVFRYPFARIDRWRSEQKKIHVDFPFANNPWAQEVEQFRSSLFFLDAPIPFDPTVLKVLGASSVVWYIAEVTPQFSEFFRSTPQVVTWTIRLIEAATGLSDR